MLFDRNYTPIWQRMPGEPVEWADPHEFVPWSGQRYFYDDGTPFEKRAKIGGKVLQEWGGVTSTAPRYEKIIRQHAEKLAPPPEQKGLGEWDAGDDVELPPPRAWLLGNIFARKFMSSLLADGGVGKTALRYAQLLSLATGRMLTGDYLFERCRVLIVSLEDDADELRRRILAVRLRYNIELSDLKGWLFLSTPGGNAGKLMMTDYRGFLARGALADSLETVITQRKIDIVSIDPFVKSHSVEENSNSAIDDVVQVLTDLATKHNIAIDAPHHVSKGTSDPGNANRGRGASSMKDAARLVYTLSAHKSGRGRSLRHQRRRTTLANPHGQRESEHCAASTGSQMVSPHWRSPP